MRGQSENPKRVSPTEIQRQGKEYHTLFQEQFTLRRRTSPIPQELRNDVKQLGKVLSVVSNPFGPLVLHFPCRSLGWSCRNFPAEVLNDYVQISAFPVLLNERYTARGWRELCSPLSKISVFVSPVDPKSSFTLLN